MQNKTKEQEKMKQTKKKNGSYKFGLNRCLNDFILIFCFFILTKNILSKTQKQRSALTLLATLSAAAKAKEKNSKKMAVNSSPLTLGHTTIATTQKLDFCQIFFLFDCLKLSDLYTAL
ncbi:unnamed protein product [Ceratitis capitata]|uniref:(Mediterranean fruit fly) hypothetical protein n=1 Tax=Ceratitis capitata TaxID=7213 RepID=A0A811U3F8_CERCA|nr:unnamed protein product [Ceratitis capitata]